MPYISNETHDHVAGMINQLLAAWQKLTTENEALKSELFCKDTIALMDECKKYATENFRLKSEIKELKDRRFVRFNNEECWIFQGDGTDNLESLVCPVVVRPDVLKRLIIKTEAMRLMIAPLSVKAGISESLLMSLLEQLEQGLLPESV